MLQLSQGFPPAVMGLRHNLPVALGIVKLRFVATSGQLVDVMILESKLRGWCSTLHKGIVTTRTSSILLAQNVAFPSE
jgi:hypothetical protein